MAAERTRRERQVDGEKACSKCGQTKPRSEFYAHPYNRDGCFNRCIVCIRAYAKARDDARKPDRAKRKPRYNDGLSRRQRWNRVHADLVQQGISYQEKPEVHRAKLLKQSRPCTDCGRAYPYWLLDWDHLRDKKFAISNAGGRRGLTRSMMDEELAKCEVVCANCHRHRTHCRKLRIAWYPIEQLD